MLGLRGVWKVVGTEVKRRRHLVRDQHVVVAAHEQLVQDLRHRGVVLKEHQARADGDVVRHGAGVRVQLHQHLEHLCVWGEGPRRRE